MTSLLTSPLWRAEDLGKPIPDSAHAVSVAMPLWAHAVGYEEGDPAVIDRLACGYPRFVYHPIIVRLSVACGERFAGPGEICLPLPSHRAAGACVDYLVRCGGGTARLADFGCHGVVAVVAPEGAAKVLKAFWQHTGWTVSSRQAAATLEAGADDGAAGEAAKTELKARLSGLYGVSADNVTLYPTGMAAVSSAHDVAKALRPGARMVQFGFPYVDVLKVQQQFGPGAEFYARGGAEALAALADLLGRETMAGLVTEVPSNPLLETPDLPALHGLLTPHGCPLIVDDTVATAVNVDVTPWADMIATSLTKNFAGFGDVMGGALILNPAAPRHGAMQDALDNFFEDLLWWEDAVVLAQRSQDFPARMAKINANASALAARLRRHPAVDRLYYPEFTDADAYDLVRRNDGGYGGLMSILTKNAKNTAASFFDRLRVSKGPSLGTDYTLACPYTILAHYGELDWAEACGVSQWLVRVSVGLEDGADLWQRFDAALSGNS